MLKIVLLLVFLFNCIKATTAYSDVYHAFWLDDLNVNQSTAFCTRYSQYTKVQLFVNSNDEILDDFSVFNTNLDTFSSSVFVGTLNSSNVSSSSPIYPRSIISNSKCFYVFRTKNSGLTNATIFFLRVNSSGSNIVFQARDSRDPNYNSTFDFFSYDDCSAFILSPPSPLPMISIESITTSVNNKDQSMRIKSALNDYVYLDTRVTAAPIVWQNLKFHTPVLLLRVCRSTVVKLSNQTGSFSRTQTSIQKGLIASPSYGGFKKIISETQSFTINSDVNMTIIFDIKQMDQSQQIILYSDDFKHTFSIKLNFTLNPYQKQFQYFGKNFKISYSQDSTSETSFLIYYTIGPANLKTRVTTISRETPSHIELLENLQPGEGSTICVSDEFFDFIYLYVSQSYGDAFKLFASYGDNFDSFDIHLQNLNTSKRNSKGVLSAIALPQLDFSKCMTIYREYQDSTFFQGVVIFKFWDGTDSNIIAPMSSTVVNLTSYNNIPYTLISPQYSVIYFSNITMKTNQTIQLSSALNQKSIINIRSNDDINLLQQLSFYTPVLSIIIPIGGFFSVSIGDRFGLNEIKQVVVGQKGVIASPAYNGFYSSSQGNNETFEILSKFSTFSFGNSIKFSSSFNSNGYADYVYIENESDHKNYSFGNGDLVLHGNSFNIRYLNVKYNNFFINYEFLGSSSTILQPAYTIMSLFILKFLSSHLIECY